MNECLSEEKKFEFDYFNLEVALEIGTHFIKYKKEKNLFISVDIFAYEKTLFHFCSDNCTKNNEDWLQKKKNTVIYFGHSTKFINIKNKNNETILQSKYGLNQNNYCITMGGFPIYLKNSGVVGSICVSGLSPEEDHALIIEVLTRTFNKKD